MDEQKKKVSVKRIVITVICVVMALLLIAVIGVAAYVSGLMGKISRDPDATLETISESQYEEMIQEEEGTLPTDSELEQIDPTDVVWEEEPTVEPTIEHDDRVINILLIGQDRTPNQKNRQRSDAMILVTVNKVKNTITLTSLMRDTYVQIPGKKDNRLNASFAFGGIKLLNETIKKNFGVIIDGNIVVDFASFEKVIDVLGGVDVKLTKTEANYLNKRPEVVDQDLVAGVNRLDGNQALQYSRIRKLSGGEFGRTERQRKVLKSIMNEVKDQSLSKINNLLNELLPLVSTDMEDSEIFDYAFELLPMLSDLTVETKRIPADGAYKQANIGGKAVIVPNLEKNRQVLQEIMSVE